MYNLFDIEKVMYVISNMLVVLDTFWGFLRISLAVVFNDTCVHYINHTVFVLYVTSIKFIHSYVN